MVKQFLQQLWLFCGIVFIWTSFTSVDFKFQLATPQTMLIVWTLNLLNQFVIRCISPTCLNATLGYWMISQIAFNDGLLWFIKIFSASCNKKAMNRLKWNFIEVHRIIHLKRIQFLFSRTSVSCGIIYWIAVVCQKSFQFSDLSGGELPAFERGFVSNWN